MFDAINNKPLYCLLLVILISAFLGTGCAHKPLTSLSEPSSSPLRPELQKTTAPIDQNPREPELGNDLGNDFFDKEFEEQQVRVADPISFWNRGMFHFNDKLYFWVLKPLARGYKAVTPHFFRKGIKNFFYNLFTPIRFVNCILQGKGNAASSEFIRFVLNTTVGVLGFGNPADRYPELNIADGEDLGQTFGKYGIGNGFYIVWPVLGPSTFRDSVGLAGDFFLNPLSYVDPLEAELAIKGFEIVNRTSFHIGKYEALKESAIDPYVALRNSYLQYREKKIRE